MITIKTLAGYVMIISVIIYFFIWFRFSRIAYKEITDNVVFNSVVIRGEKKYLSHISAELQVTVRKLNVLRYILLGSGMTFVFLILFGN